MEPEGSQEADVRGVPRRLASEPWKRRTHGRYAFANVDIAPTSQVAGNAAWPYLEFRCLKPFARYVFNLFFNEGVPPTYKAISCMGLFLTGASARAERSSALQKEVLCVKEAHSKRTCEEVQALCDLVLVNLGSLCHGQSAQHVTFGRYAVCAGKRAAAQSVPVRF